MGFLQHGEYTCVFEEGKRLPALREENYEPLRRVYCVGKMNLWTHLKKVLLIN
jgi:hypothetical protein